MFDELPKIKARLEELTSPPVLATEIHEWNLKIANSLMDLTGHIITRSNHPCHIAQIISILETLAFAIRRDFSRDMGAAVLNEALKSPMVCWAEPTFGAEKK